MRDPQPTGVRATDVAGARMLGVQVLRDMTGEVTR